MTKEKTEGWRWSSQGISARLGILGASQPTVTAPSDSGCSDCARDMLDMCGATNASNWIGQNWHQMTSSLQQINSGVSSAVVILVHWAPYQNWNGFNTCPEVPNWPFLYCCNNLMLTILTVFVKNLNANTPMTLLSGKIRTRIDHWKPEQGHQDWTRQAK